MTSALTACCAARVVTRVPSASVHMRRNVLMNTRRASKQARVSVTTKASGEWGPPPSVANSPERVSLEVQTMDSHTNNIQTGYERGDSTRGLADERRDIAAKAKQLMNIDPNDPRA
ncbi:hypothetical protein N9L76_10170, partial [bacterium]|nr:hypothetical protein [bacterium]